MKKTYLSHINPIILSSAVFLLISIIFGTITAATLKPEQNADIYKYLSGFFSQYSENLNKNAVCRRSFYMNMRFYIPIILSGFFVFGFIPGIAASSLKGFVWGFCSGLYIKYYSAKGVFLALASFPSYFLSICAIIFFSAAAFECRQDNDKKTAVLYYMLLSFVFLVVLSLSSLSDGYISSPLISLIISKL